MLGFARSAQPTGYGFRLSFNWDLNYFWEWSGLKIRLSNTASKALKV